MMRHDGMRMGSLRWFGTLVILALAVHASADATLTTAYEYDQYGQATVIYTYAGASTYSYTSTSYDELGRITLQRRHATAGSTGNDDHVTLTAYDVMGNVVTTSVQLDASDTSIGTGDINTIYVYDALGRRTTVIDPEGTVTLYDYDASGNVLTASVQLDGTTISIGAGDINTIYAYDELNRATRVTDPEGGIRLTDYDSAGRPRRVISNDGADDVHQVRYAYDNAGRQTLMALMANPAAALATAPSSNTDQLTLTEYDAGGRVVTKTDPASQTQIYAYSGQGWLTQAGYDIAGGPSQALVYDDIGQLTEQLDYDGAQTLTTALIYDPLGRMVTKIKTGAGGSPSVTHQYSYNAADQLAYEIPPTVAYINYYYDLLARRTYQFTYAGTAYAERPQTWHGYDRAGRLTSLKFQQWMTPSTAEQTDYAYDKAGRCITVTYPDDGEMLYAYDHVGRMTLRTDPDGDAITYGYDRAGRLTQRAGGDHTDDYAYDTMGRMVEATADYAGGGATLSWAYDELGQVSEHGMDYGGSTAGTVSYTYDAPKAQRLTTEYPNGRELAYAYDTLGRVSLIQQSGDTVAELSYLGTGYRYDTKAVYDPADDSTAVLSVAPEYDGLNRMVRLPWYSPVAAATRADLQFGYDVGGNPTYAYNALEPDHSFTYAYDGLDRVVGYEYGYAAATAKDTIVAADLVASQDYHYDAFGNWLSTDIQPAGYDEQSETRTHNSVNELTEAVMPTHTREYPDPDIYVDTNGDDSTGDGSSGNPYATINWAIAMATDGDVIQVNDSAQAYASFSISSTDAQDLMIVGQTPGSVVIGSGNVSVLSGCQGIVLDGLDVGGAGGIYLNSPNSADLVARRCSATTRIVITGSATPPAGAPPLVEDCSAGVWMLAYTDGLLRRCRSNVIVIAARTKAINCVAGQYAAVMYDPYGSDSQPVLRNTIAPYLYVYWDTGPSSSAGFTTDYNDYYGYDSGGTVTMVYWWNDVTSTPTVYTTSQLATWQGTLQDFHSITADPLLEQDGYTLSANSPCIDRGLPVAPTQLGHGGRTDMGVYEYDTRSGGTATLAYDAAGSLTSDGDRLYEYDGLGRLTYVASNANTAGQGLAAYRYDALGRLAMRITYDYMQFGSDPFVEYNTTKHFYYDTPPTSASTADGGRQILPQVIETTTTDDYYSSWRDEYVWGPSYVDELLIHDTGLSGSGLGAPSPERLLAVHDRQYSVLAVTDGDGAVVEQRTYSPYGADPTDPRQGLASVTDADGHPVHPADLATDILYTGIHYDPVIGENHHRARRLSHNLGRWTTRDQRGIVGWDMNTRPDPLRQYHDGASVYSYVSASPGRYGDPTGARKAVPEDLFGMDCCGESDDRFADYPVFTNCPDAVSHLGGEPCGSSIAGYVSWQETKPYSFPVETIGVKRGCFCLNREWRPWSFDKYKILGLRKGVGTAKASCRGTCKFSIRYNYVARGKWMWLHDSGGGEAKRELYVEGEPEVSSSKLVGKPSVDNVTVFDEEECSVGKPYRERVSTMARLRLTSRKYIVEEPRDVCKKTLQMECERLACSKR